MATGMLTCPLLCHTEQSSETDDESLYADTRPPPPHITINYAPMKDIPITVPLSFVDDPNDSSSSDGDSTSSLPQRGQEDHSTATSPPGQMSNKGSSRDVTGVHRVGCLLTSPLAA